MKISKQYIIHGKVQGVGFRYYVRSISIKMGVYGWVRNKFDGTVEVMAIMREDQIKNYEKKLEIGNGYSNVDYIEKNEIKLNKEYLSFEIVY